MFCVDHVFSDEITVSTGVSQQCVLSLLLFSFYINGTRLQDRDMMMSPYADDVVMLVSKPNYVAQVCRLK